MMTICAAKGLLNKLDKTGSAVAVAGRSVTVVPVAPPRPPGLR